MLSSYARSQYQGWQLKKTINVSICIPHRYYIFFFFPSQIGDYGLAPSVFLDDYVPVKGDHYPVRWIPPEMLRLINARKSNDSSDDNDDEDSTSEDDTHMPPHAGTLVVID